MIVSIVAAMTKGKVIGIDNKLPWHISEELKYFKSITINKPIVMGRKTAESIKKPLPNRRNIVITSNANNFKELEVLGFELVGSIEQALELLKNEDEVMIIGGGKIFESCLNIATRMYLSIIKKEYQGDCFFPTYNINDWKLVKSNDFEDFEARVLEKIK